MAWLGPRGCHGLAYCYYYDQGVSRENAMYVQEFRSDMCLPIWKTNCCCSVQLISVTLIMILVRSFTCEFCQAILVVYRRDYYECGGISWRLLFLRHIADSNMRYVYITWGTTSARLYQISNLT